MTTLLMSSRHTEDDQAIWRAAIGRGWCVVRARGIRLPDFEDDEVVMNSVRRPVSPRKFWLRRRVSLRRRSLLMSARLQVKDGLSSRQTQHGDLASTDVIRTSCWT